MTRGLLAGIAVGAGVMYLLDPNKGRRRRAVLRDKMTSSATRLQRELERVAQDTENRTAGLKARSRQIIDRAMHRGEDVDDQTLVARVRSSLGRVIDNPHSVNVQAEKGRVLLTGEVYQDEISRILKAVQSVAGVHEVADQLEIRAENAPSSENSARSNRWSPAMQLAALAGGSILTLYGIKKRGLLGSLGGFAGSALTSRGLRSYGS